MEAGGGISRRSPVLVAMILALGMLTIDVTVVRVALPSIQRELGISAVEQAWIVNAYLLALGVLVIAGGRAGDLFGRRRVFLFGLVLFTACSALSGLAGDGGLLIAARAGQGAGAAIMTPGVYSIVTDAFAGPGLSAAMGALTGTAAIGLSLGPLLGGLLIDLGGWRWIFFINVPIGIAAAIAVLRTVPERRVEDAPRLDLRGLALLAVALTALNVGLMQAETWGWLAAATLALVAVGIAGLAVFAAVERRTSAPLVDLAVLRGRASATANGVGFAAQFVSTALTVLVAIYLQDGLGESPLATGALLLPMTLPLLIGAPLAGRLVPRFGTRALVAVGMGLVAVGTIAVGLAALGSGYPPLIPGLVAFGAGFAVVLTVLTSAVMGAAGSHDRGMVSGVYNTARNVGASLGVAVTSSLLATLQRHHPLDDAFAVTMVVTGLVAAAAAAAAAAFLSARANPAPVPPAHGAHPPHV